MIYNEETQTENFFLSKEWCIFNYQHPSQDRVLAAKAFYCLSSIYLVQKESRNSIIEEYKNTTVLLALML